MQLRCASRQAPSDSAAHVPLAKKPSERNQMCPFIGPRRMLVDRLLPYIRKFSERSILARSWGRTTIPATPLVWWISLLLESEKRTWTPFSLQSVLAFALYFPQLPCLDGLDGLHIKRREIPQVKSLWLKTPAKGASCARMEDFKVPYFF